MELLYSDRDIAVCIKPPNLLSEKNESGNDIITALEQHFEKTGEKCTVFPLHRLDLGVGGVMVFAKNRLSAAKMSECIKERLMDKEYLAVICGVPEDKSGVYSDLLFKDSKKNRSYVVDRERKGVKKASLEYELLSTARCDGETLSLVKIKLHTGRSHQIRVQFSHRKTPLYGDRKYGAKCGTKIALWSYRLKFTHPTSGESMIISHLPNGDIWDIFDITKIR